MKARLRWAGALAILTVSILPGLPGSAQAEVNLNINIGSPPVVVADPAEIAAVPGIGVYFVPGSDPDLFFYADFWWSPRGDRWYRSPDCRGPWVVVESRIVPREVIRVPKDYRSRYSKALRVPYGQWKKARYRKVGDGGRGTDRHDRKGHRGGGKRGHGHDD